MPHPARGRGRGAMSTKKAARRSRTAAGWSETKAGTVTLNDAAMDGDCGTITGMLDSGHLQMIDDVNALIGTVGASVMAHSA